MTVNNNPNSVFGNRFLFTGREWLSDLRLYDYRNRMYQPELGRFLQPDPKQFEAGDYNLYRYCHNDPINRTDPTGLLELQLTYGVGGTAGVGHLLSAFIHVEVNVGLAINMSDPGDSKVFLHAQAAFLPVGEGAIMNVGTQQGAAIARDPTSPGLSSNPGIHIEGGAAKGPSIAGSADITLGRDEKGSQVASVGGGKAREGVGGGVYGAAGPSVNVQITSPSVRDVLKNLTEKE